MNPPAFGYPNPSISGALENRTALKRHASRLGYAGLIPFVGLSALSAIFYGDTQLQQLVGESLVGYGAVIISFLGALHWAKAISAVSGKDHVLRMSFAVSPALAGWLATQLPLGYGFLLVISGLLVTYMADKRWCYGDDWYLRLRGRLTQVATLSMLFPGFIALGVV